MGERVVEADGTTVMERRPAMGRGRGRGAAPEGPLGGGEGTTGGGRSGAKGEPQVPFQPWAAAVYDYNSKTSRSTIPKATAFRRAARA